MRSDLDDRAGAGSGWFGVEVYVCKWMRGTWWRWRGKYEGWYKRCVVFRRGNVERLHTISVFLRSVAKIFMIEVLYPKCYAAMLSRTEHNL